MAWKRNPVLKSLNFCFKEGKRALDIAYEQENQECVRAIEKYAIKLKPGQSVSSLISNDFTLFDDSIYEYTDEKSNFKTSTFDEEKLNKLISKFEADSKGVQLSGDETKEPEAENEPDEEEVLTSDQSTVVHQKETPKNDEK